MTDVRTIRLCIANAVGVTTGEKNGERVLRAAAKTGADIIAMSEADDIQNNDETPVLPKGEWEVFHKQRDDDKDGTLLAFRKASIVMAGAPSWTLSTPDHIGDRHFDINPRWALTVPVRFGLANAAPIRTITAVHWPPARDAGLLPLAYQAMHDLDPDLFAGDLNVRYATVARNFPARDVRGAEVLHAAGKQHMRLGRAKAVELAGSDHPGVIVSMPV